MSVKCIKVGGDVKRVTGCCYSLIILLAIPWPWKKTQHAYTLHKYNLMETDFVN